MELAQVFSYGGRDFAAGLLWQPLTSTNTGERATEIKGIGKELDLNLQVVHRDGLCTGLAKSGAEIKAGVASLAMAVVDRLHELSNARDFLFVADLGGGRWYYLAQKDGVIIPERDQIIDSEEIAKTMFYQDNSIGEWGNMFLPGHWGVALSEEAPSLEELLPLGRKGELVLQRSWVLAPITVTAAQMVTKHAKPLVLALAVVAACAYGLNEFKAYQRTKAIEQARRVAAELEASKAAEMPRPRPWGEIPMASEQKNACLGTLEAFTLFPGNWDLASVSCTGGVVVVAWKPSGRGWIDHLKSVVPDAVISLDGSLASSTRPLPSLPIGKDEEVSPSNARVAEMYSAAQRYGFKLTVSAPARSNTQVLPGQKRQGGAEPLWDELTWKADGVTLPDAVVDALDGSGFRLRSMAAQWKGGRMIWMMEGSQYVRK